MDYKAFPLDNPAGIEKLKLGSALAWRELVESYDAQLRSDILASLLKRGLGDESVDDIIQEIWLSAVQSIQQFEWKEDGKLYHWLRIIGLNLVRRRVRQLPRSGAPIRLDTLGSATTSSWQLGEFMLAHGLVQDDLEADVFRKADVATIYGAIAAIKNDQHRQVVMMVLLHMMKPQEVAGYLDLNPRNISMIVWRFKQNLLDQFGDNNDNPHDMNENGGDGREASQDDVLG